MTASVTPISSVAPSCCASLQRGQLRLALQTALPFVSTDAMRPHLLGALLEVADGSLTIVATDGRALSKFTIATAVTGAKAARAVFNVDDVKTAIKALACRGDDASKSVELFIDSGTIRIEILNARHSFDTLKIDFPPYEQVIPRDERDIGTNRIQVNPDFLMRAGKCAALMKRGMTMSFGAADEDPIVCKVEAHEEGSLTIVIMPMKF